MRIPEENIGDLLNFLNTSTSPYHAVDNVRKRLLDEGFSHLDEWAVWEPAPGGHFIERDGSIIAWYQHENIATSRGLAIIAAHTDSPNLRLKPVLKGHQSGLSQFGIEVYGGVLLNSWLDRDLGISGRVITHDPEKGLNETLVQVNEPLAKIPQLAIHLNRNVNENGLVLNPHQHLRPIWNDFSSEITDFLEIISTKANLNLEDIKSWDLMLHDLQPASLLGAERQWISSARIDNLVSCFAAINSFLEATKENHLKKIPVICLFNHEEVGSTSSAGAAGNLLPSAVRKILENRNITESIAKSKLISADGAHATHPNYLDKHDPDHEVRMNGGIAIKRNSNERYSTNAHGQAFAQLICERNDIPYQLFSNRSDLACGSTIGPISSANLGIATIDLGVPQLSMHSTRELCGYRDTEYLQNFMLNFLKD